MPNRSDSPPIINAPPLVIGLTVLVLATHAVRLVLPAQMQDLLMFTSAVIPERMWPSDPALAYDNILAAIWPLFGHAFLHGDWMHVIVNSVMLLALGKPVYTALGAGDGSGERGRRAIGFLLVFVLSAIAGGAAHLLTNYPNGPAAIGASGGVAGLFAGAFLVMQRSMDGGGIRLLSRRFLSLTAAFVALNGVLAFAGPTMFGSGIAWQAHIGGYVAGALIFRLLTLRSRV